MQNNKQSNLVFVENSQAITDSLTIAEMFNKEHKNVLRDIQTQIEYAGKEFSQLNFEPSTYRSRGKVYPKFNLTEEAFTVVVFSYNTKEAVQTKIKFIQEFKRMKEYIQNQQRPILPQNYKEALQHLLIKVEENEKLTTENLMLEQRVNELKPKADYTDTILQNKGLVNVGQIAKDYGMSAQKMNDLLHDLKVQYKQGKQWLLYAKYQSKGYTHSNTIDIRRSDGSPDVKMQTKWTQKGRLFIYELLKRHDIVPMIEREYKEAQ